MPTPRTAASITLALAFCVPAGSTAAAGDEILPAAGPVDMPAVVDRFGTDARAVRRFYSISTSPTRLDRLDAFEAEWSDLLSQVEFDGLDQSGRIDHLLLRSHLEHERKQRDNLRSRLAETSELLAFGDTIIALEEARWRLDPIDGRRAAEQLAELKEAVEDTKKRVEKGHKAAKKKKARDTSNGDGPADEQEAVDEAAEDENGASDGAGGDPDGDGDEEEASADDAEVEPLEVSAVVANRTARTVDQLERTLGTWHEQYAKYEPGFAWWTDKPYQAADKALKELSDYLRKTVAGIKGEDDDPLIGDPIGRDALLDDLASEWIPYAPEQLLTIGEEQFAWCEEQMLAASRELGHGDDWKAALAAVKDRHMEPGEQDDLVRAQAEEAVRFLDDRDLVTVPDLCRETWRLDMIDERQQRTTPYAYYGGQYMAVAYPTANMDHESKLMAMRGNNEHFSRIVTPHELIPGHHLQGFMVQRLNIHRVVFRTPFLTEGWALYWEMRLWDLGWARGPEDRIGMLFWRMHRAARILVSLGFHLERMTPEEMIDFLVDRVGHEKDGATSEVRRYIGGGYGPLYQCAYMIGGLQLYALHQELVGGGRMTEREFHDAVLEQNSIPIDMIRAALTGESLNRDERPSWWFAGDVTPSEPPSGSDAAGDAVNDG